MEGHDVHAIGASARKTIGMGEMSVSGVLRVKSAFVKFDEFMCNRKPFQLVVELKHFGAEGEKEVGTISFDEVYLLDNDFSLDRNGEAISEYKFTGTRIRTKMGDREFDFSALK